MIKQALPFTLLLLASCSDATEPLPPLEEIQTANLAYVRCIDGAVDALDAALGSREAQIQTVREACSSERSTALRMKAVPVFAETIAEYDEIHDGLAENLISARSGV